MSALPPKADIGWHVSNVRFVPIADIAASVDHLVGAAMARVAAGAFGFLTLIQLFVRPEMVTGFNYGG
jgi:hypothetical protein